MFSSSWTAGAEDKACSLLLVCESSMSLRLSISMIRSHGDHYFRSHRYVIVIASFLALFKCPLVFFRVLVVSLFFVV
jgi:hypothetical protein